MAPPDAYLPDFQLGELKPSMISTYRQLDGTLFCCVARYEPRHSDERKLIIPWAYGKLSGVVGWHRKMPPGPCPLLGIDEYASQSEAFRY